MAILFLLLGALCGGLRALLASPLRRSLTTDLPEVFQKRANAAANAGSHIASTAGLLRIFFLTAAVADLLQTTEELEILQQWPLWTLYALTAGVLLEGVPALVIRGRARRICLLILPLVQLAAWPLRPLTRLLEISLDFLGVDLEQNGQGSLAAELLDVAREHDRTEELDAAEKKMIARVIELPETDAAEVMTPRTELTAIPAQATVAEAATLANEAGHSRLPAYEEDHDHIAGIFYLKDVLPAWAHGEDVGGEKVRKYLRPAYFVPETMRIPALLEELRRRRVHLAIVVDEYGGTAGVVTIEDLLEEIVGEIQDEHDQEEDPIVFQLLNDQTAIADGRMGVDELNEAFPAKLPEDEAYDTLAGLLFERFGHIPKVGETLQLNYVTLEITQADDRRIQRVKLTSLVKPTPAP
ncbi:MAG: hemolysin family protein [Planctomycetota bacterium]|nr:hemolysin family protein [Planctomycetota bacterium]